MADWDEVRRIALSLPETSESILGHGKVASWKVRDKTFVWERPLRPKEAQELGDAAPTGPILAARVEHFGAKEALLADDPDVYFTTAHFEGYPAILVRLDVIALADLNELIAEAWLARAPKKLAESYLS
jgi:hypothetical protein